MNWRQRERQKEENMRNLGEKSGEWKALEEVQPPWNGEREGRCERDEAREVSKG